MIDPSLPRPQMQVAGQGSCKLFLRGSDYRPKELEVPELKTLLEALLFPPCGFPLGPGPVGPTHRSALLLTGRPVWEAGFFLRSVAPPQGWIRPKAGNFLIYLWLEIFFLPLFLGLQGPPSMGVPPTPLEWAPVGTPGLYGKVAKLQEW